jgi:hypothetical protein
MVEDSGAAAKINKLYVAELVGNKDSRSSLSLDTAPYEQA